MSLAEAGCFAYFPLSLLYFRQQRLRVGVVLVLTLIGCVKYVTKRPGAGAFCVLLPKGGAERDLRATRIKTKMAIAFILSSPRGELGGTGRASVVALQLNRYALPSSGTTRHYGSACWLWGSEDIRRHPKPIRRAMGAVDTLQGTSC